MFGGEVVRAPRADARQDVDDRARRPRRVHAASPARSSPSRYHSLVVAEDGLPASSRSRRGRATTARSWACGTARWPVHGVQFHPESILTGEGRRILRNFLGGDGLTMFPDAASKSCTRHEDLTSRRGRGGDGRGHGRPRRAGADRRPADRPGDEGRAAGGDRRPRADDARARGAAVAALRRRVRHLRHRRRSSRHLQHLVVRGAGRRRVRRARRQARQPVGVEPVRQRRRVRSARRPRHRAAGGRRALPRRGRHRLLLRADVSSVDAARRRRRAASSACGRRSTCSAR